MVIEIFWSFHNGKHPLSMGILDFHRRGDNILGIKFISRNMLFQIFYQTWEC